MMKSYTIEVGHTYFTGYGKTVAEAKANAQKEALLVKWGMKPFKA